LLDNSNSKIGFRSIHVVGEATALFPCSTPTTGSKTKYLRQQVISYLLVSILLTLLCFLHNFIHQ